MDGPSPSGSEGLSKKNKVVLLGNQGVGKTSILQYFVHGIFNDEYNPTIGLDYSTKTVEENGVAVKLQLWDTAGQERFRSLTSQYVNGAAAAIVVFDVSNRSTFESVNFWVQEVKKQRQQEAKVYIVANKADLSDQRTVTEEEARKNAMEFECKYFEVSAKLGTNVRPLFSEIVKDLIGSSTTKEVPQAPVEGGLEIKAQPAAKSSGCCG